MRVDYNYVLTDLLQTTLNINIISNNSPEIVLIMVMMLIFKGIVSDFNNIFLIFYGMNHKLFSEFQLIPIFTYTSYA